MKKVLWKCILIICKIGNGLNWSPSTNYWVIAGCPHFLIHISHTFFCWIGGSHWTEGSFTLVVVYPNFDLVRGEGWNTFILEHVSRSFRGCDSSLHPALCPEWAESNHISKARTTLQLLRDGLRRYDMTQTDDSREASFTDLIDINIFAEMQPCTD